MVHGRYPREFQSQEKDSCAQIRSASQPTILWTLTARRPSQCIGLRRWRDCSFLISIISYLYYISRHSVLPRPLRSSFERYVSLALVLTVTHHPHRTPGCCMDPFHHCSLNAVSSPMGRRQPLKSCRLWCYCSLLQWQMVGVPRGLQRGFCTLYSSRQYGTKGSLRSTESARARRGTRSSGSHGSKRSRTRGFSGASTPSTATSRYSAAANPSSLRQTRGHLFRATMRAGPLAQRLCGLHFRRRIRRAASYPRSRI